MWQLFRRESQRSSLLQRYKAVFVASNHMHREFQRNGVSAEKLHVIPLPAADRTLLNAVPIRKTPQGRILFIGRLTDLKGTDYLIKAIDLASKRLGRPLSLTIAGDGPERPKLEGLTHGLGTSVTFAGWVQTRQATELMREADLLAVPSLWPEPFGMVGVEAGSFGIPSVAYAVGGIQDWLISGQTGEIAPGDPPTIEGLAAAIVRSLADTDHYNELCLGAWEMVRRFTLEGHLAGLEPALEAECPCVHMLSHLHNPPLVTSDDRR
jgi:glycosyltransferase involved in cell wall biosynthesis